MNEEPRPAERPLPDYETKSLDVDSILAAEAMISHPDPAVEGPSAPSEPTLPAPAQTGESSTDE